MSFIRTKKNTNFSVIDNTGLRDERLSFKATGLLAYLLQLPDDWKIYMTDLVKRKKDGKDSLQSAIKELIDNGYMKRNPLKENGKFAGYEYIIYESGTYHGGKTAADNPSTVKPITGNPQLLNTNVLSTNELNTNQLHNLSEVQKLHLYFIKKCMDKYKSRSDIEIEKKVSFQFIHDYFDKISEKVIDNFFNRDIVSKFEFIHSDFEQFILSQNNTKKQTQTKQMSQEDIDRGMKEFYGIKE